MAPIITLVLDLLIAGLLIATITYAILLNRKLIQLQEGRSEMEVLIRSFSEATSRAEAGIKAMKRTAAETGEGLQKNIERGQALRDELQFMMEAADALAQRLAEVPTAVRGGQPGLPPAPARRPAPEPPRSELRRLPGSDDDMDLPRNRGALTRGEPARPEPRRASGADDGPDLPRGRGALTRGEPARSEPRRQSDPDDDEGDRDLPRGRGVLARLEPVRSDPGRRPPARTEPAERSQPPAEDQRPPRRDGAEGLSRAERELLEAMESRR